METTQSITWHQYPTLALPAPVLALALGAGGIWVGGPGGVAWRAAGSDWQPCISGLPLTSITALEYIGGMLVAGGSDGIAFSKDGGASWEKADIQEGVASITALAASPNFAQDKTILAATLESGIIRTEDGGKNWLSVNFGLQNFEMNALAWGAGDNVIAATTDGLYRSTNAGRAWRFVRDSEALSIVALAYQPNGALLAAVETEGLLISHDDGKTWESYGDVPDDVQITSLWVTSNDSVLLGTTSHGLLRIKANGLHWENVLTGTVLSFGSNGQILYAGTTSGIHVSVDDGHTWRIMPHPPIHDLRRIAVQDKNIYLSGIHAGIIRYIAGKSWEVAPNVPYPTTSAHIGPNNSLLVAGQTGLLRSEDTGETWETVIHGEPGNVSHISFREDGFGCAGSTDGTYFHRTFDGGKSWQPIKVPLGILPLATLLVTERWILAVTYDPRQYNVQVFRSLDQGTTWERGMEAQTTWPLVASYSQPAILTLADSVIREVAPEQWEQVTPEKGAGIRRIAGNGQKVFLYTTKGLLSSSDQGKTWKHHDENLPTDQLLDIAVDADTLYVLLSDGQVWSTAI